MSRTAKILHRRHAIKTMRNPSGWHAQAFRGSTAVGDRMTAATQDAAVLAVSQALDSRASRLQQMRGPSGFPCADEVREALPNVRMSKAQEAMLLAHFNAPNHTLTATELANAAGYQDYAVANRLYGQLGRDLATELEWTPAQNEKGVTIWTYTLAEDAGEDAPVDGDAESGEWRWHLRPAIVEAVRQGASPKLA